MTRTMATDALDTVDALHRYLLLTTEGGNTKPLSHEGVQGRIQRTCGLEVQLGFGRVLYGGLCHTGCNRPWVMWQHRAHVSSITGLIYYCTRLGLSSTASLIVSSLFHLHHSP
jgi:hypothetical protein